MRLWPVNIDDRRVLKFLILPRQGNREKPPKVVGILSLNHQSQKSMNPVGCLSCFGEIEFYSRPVDVWSEPRVPHTNLAATAWQIQNSLTLLDVMEG
jgi:hypothetical protein